MGISRIGRILGLGAVLPIAAAAVVAFAGPAAADTDALLVEGPGWTVAGDAVGGISVVDDVFDGAPARVVGDVEIASGAGAARVTIDVRRLPFIPVATGRLKVSDPSAGIDVYATVLGRLAYDDTTREVRGRAFTIRQRGLLPTLSVIRFRVVDAVPDPGDHVEELVHAGHGRRAIVHVPPGHDPGEQTPVLVNFHGFLEQDWMVDLFGATSAHADRNGYITVYPKSIGLQWAPNNAGVDEFGFVDALVARLVAEYGADPTRIYATGFSNGGRLTNALACTRSDLFAAFVPLHGYLEDGDPTVFPVADCDPGRGVPITLIYGTEDPFMPYDGLAPTLDLWVANNGCDPESRTITDLPDLAPGDGTIVRRHDWTCPADAPVVHFEIVGGGHNWPGGKPFLPPPLLLGEQTYDIDANDVVWDFVAPFTRD